MSKDIHSSSIPIKHVKIKVLIFGWFRMVLDPLIIYIPIPMLAWFHFGFWCLSSKAQRINHTATHRNHFTMGSETTQVVEIYTNTLQGTSRYHIPPTVNCGFNHSQGALIVRGYVNFLRRILSKTNYQVSACCSAVEKNPTKPSVWIFFSRGKKHIRNFDKKLPKSSRKSGGLFGKSGKSLLPGNGTHRRTGQSQ